VIGEIGTAGGTGYVIEYAGQAVRALSMEGRMTLCNLTIEGGAAPAWSRRREDLRLYAGRPRLQRARPGTWPSTIGRASHSDPDAVFDRDRLIDAAPSAPDGHLGHQPRGRHPGHRRRPDPASFATPTSAPAAQRALDYMGLTAGQPIEARIDRGLHRLVHQQPHRGHARRRRVVQAPSCTAARSPTSGPWSCRARAW
jgi:3-isopropylmalate/(R)-2-methylmalate dehydratase large subunit